jgi:transcriptional regulator with XRE-family HTH domain
MKARGWSINRLADFSGLGRGHLSELLSLTTRRSPTLRTIVKLADALEVPCFELLREQAGTAQRVK